LELENEHLNCKQTEENQKYSERFLIFSILCKKYLLKIKSINELFFKIEDKNIKSVLQRKEKILREINDIINDFNSTLGNPDLFSDLRNNDFNLKLLNKIEENDNQELSKLFTFVDVLGNLEENVKMLSKQNELLNQRFKNDVILNNKTSLFSG